MRKNQYITAILFQAQSPPSVDGIFKPLKEGGYSDSGADIALALLENGIQVVTPVENPDLSRDLDWVFPDSEEGIERAIALGSNQFWLNTVLYPQHPIMRFKHKNISLIGQQPESVGIFDDKFYTNHLLLKYNLPVAKSQQITTETIDHLKLEFPLVLKPVRGRGSQGVLVVHNQNEYKNRVIKLISSNLYGTKIMVEEFLPGKEITITIMPPGEYVIRGGEEHKISHWAIPVVKRFNHENDIAPYNGIVAVVNNSKILSAKELESTEIQNISKKCEIAASVIEAKAPIRIDCRQNRAGVYYIFDLNMKPNMTGPSRPHRIGQDSLTMIAARGIGWDYPELILQMHNQHWKF